MASRPLLAIDPGAAASPHPSIMLLREPSESLLPAVCERTGTVPDRTLHADDNR